MRGGVVQDILKTEDIVAGLEAYLMAFPFLVMKELKKAWLMVCQSLGVFLDKAVVHKQGCFPESSSMVEVVAEGPVVRLNQSFPPYCLSPALASLLVTLLF